MSLKVTIIIALSLCFFSTTGLQAQAASKDYLSPELRQQVDQLSKAVNATPTTVKTLKARSEIFWLWANAYAASGLKDIKPGSVWLSILPMSHTYEFTCGFILPLLVGGRIAYAGKTPTPAILQKLCASEKPFAIFAVPLVLEKIYKKRVLI